MASGQQLARLFQRSCLLFNQNASKLSAGITCQCSVSSKKYQTGSFSVNRYLHSSLSQLPNTPFKTAVFNVNRHLHTSVCQSQNNKQHLSTAAPLQGQKDEGSESKELVVQKVNETLHREDLGRLFAVIHIQSKQRKVTTEDLLVVEGYFYPNVGDKIRLEKVLLVGGADFTLAGRPLLSRNQVKVEATVIEKTLSHFHVRFD